MPSTMAVMSADSVALIVSRSGTLSHASTATSQQRRSRRAEQAAPQCPAHLAPVTFGGEPGFGGSVV